jgi:hypothetical protein
MKQIPVLATVAGALVLLALPVAGQPRRNASPDPSSSAPAAAPSREALVTQCDAQASARKLSGVARGNFMSECLGGKPGEKPKPGSAPDGSANLQSREVQDAQFRKWNSAAERAMKSICAGCSQGATASRPKRAKARPKPPEDDEVPEAGLGTVDADD